MNPVKSESAVHSSAVDVTRPNDATPDAAALAALAARIRQWASELGFDAVGITDTDLSHAEPALLAWLAAGFHGEMDYMAKHGLKRARPAELVPGTVRVISLRMAYLPAILPGFDVSRETGSRERGIEPAAMANHSDAPPADADDAQIPDEGRVSIVPHRDAPDPTPPSTDRRRPRPDWRAAQFARYSQPGEAVVSVYARGRDYHKVLRSRLQKLAERIEAEIGAFGHRVFTDSAPVLEVELAKKAGIGWRGKHTLLLERDAGSFFFLGELFVDLPLPVDTPAAAQAEPARAQGQCGSCTRCIDVCPTQAIVAPYMVDARRCISYLTIELAGSIPEPLRPLIGNRVYGCDDCQLICPWNKFAQVSQVDDFEVRNGLDRATLLELWEWTARDFDDRLAGTAIRRIGYERWVRNLAVGLGNALRAETRTVPRASYIAALRARSDDASAVVREHVEWALRDQT